MANNNKNDNYQSLNHKCLVTELMYHLVTANLSLILLLWCSFMFTYSWSRVN